MMAARNAAAAAMRACLNNVMNRILRASKVCVWVWCEFFTHRPTGLLTACDGCFMGESRLVCNSDTCDSRICWFCAALGWVKGDELGQISSHDWNCWFAYRLGKYDEEKLPKKIEGKLIINKG